jgi:peptidoglycan LD-endopeptidase CwlK
MNTNKQNAFTLPRSKQRVDRVPRRRTVSRRPARKPFKIHKIYIWLVLAIALLLGWNELQSLSPVLPHITTRDVPPVTGLHPVVAQKEAELAAEAKEKGISIVITDGFRSADEQNKLYQQGRTNSGLIVTNVKGGYSYHNYGLAIDFALRTKTGNVIWDLEFDGNRNGKPDWMEVVDIAKQKGFSWGGDWEGSFKDYPHLQMDFGYSIQELQRGERPPVDKTP